MHILYKVTYLPHLNTKCPKYYVGSKHNYKGNYFGSVDSKQVYEYTEGLRLRDWWKKQKKDTKNFLFEIIESFEEITPQELVEKEHDLHIKLNVLGDDYFNHSIATKGYCSIKNSEKTKKIKSEKTKLYWDSESGQNKKQKLIERNKTVHKKNMLEKWKNPTEPMLNKVYHGRTKGSKDLQKRKQKPIKKIYAEGLIFNDAIEASKHFGIHPVNIRRRCRLNYNENWRYLIESCDNN